MSEQDKQPQDRPGGTPSDSSDVTYWPRTGGIPFDTRDVAGREALARMEVERQREDETC